MKESHYVGPVSYFERCLNEIANASHSICSTYSLLSVNVRHARFQCR